MILDPQTAGPRPPFSGQQQTRPGFTANMDPNPDHGEHSYRGNGKLAGRAALITGADSGIGRAVAIAFAREGADLLISYLCEHDDAKETARWVEEVRQRAVLVPGDVSDATHCRELINRAIQELGHLDILVNNTASQASHASTTISPMTSGIRRFARISTACSTW
jgi:NAD(P)-dependent dehydrogenase (short-subunit alcohol dehydrogenase family)